MAELNFKPKKIDLFADDRAFDLMTTAVDETKVDTELFKAEEPSTKGIHTALLAAGMAPGIGNLADAADALLFLAEGELGEAAWSMGAMLPFIGQYVSGRRALKIAKEAGEETVTLYRGVDKWYPKRKMVEGEIVDTGNTMVKKGKIVGGGRWQDQYSSRGSPGWDTKKSETADAVWVSTNKKSAKTDWNVRPDPEISPIPDSEHPLVMIFEVPKSMVKKYGHKGGLIEGDMVFEGGIPKRFLVKVEGFKKGRASKIKHKAGMNPLNEYKGVDEGGRYTY